ncbi:DUF418 domain-containing protein [Nonomuraea lactucae]|uniref:DUF418 domain-containing protein n=1 Tax=Nonomuraea lactucae TaxID=2249762 RepID=UPI0013B37DF0|nr:DUF418 domain-containing protein [Nonomuraea lactucae]
MDAMARTGGAKPAASTRITDIDGLRGFAVLGILAVNMLDLADPGRVFGVRSFTGPVDTAVEGFITGAGLLTFLTLFAFLFGYSFSLQLAGAQAEGASVVPRTLRRLLTLIAIGAAHLVFLWRGDILMLWGLLGLLLLALHGIRARTALILALSLATLALLYQGFNVLTAEPEAAAPVMTEEARAALAATLAGGLDYVSFNLGTFAVEDLYLQFLEVPSMFTVFLLGYAAGRARWLENDEVLDRWLPRIQLIGFAVGVPTAVALAWVEVSDGDFMSIPGLAGTFGAPFLVAFLAATLLRMSRRGSRVLRVLAPAGVMSLSNYLMQSVLMCLLFTGYGLALAGRVPPLGILGVTAVICVLQVLCSAWWTRRFRYGPVEWVLRSATYGRLADMRR